MKIEVYIQLLTLFASALRALPLDSNKPRPTGNPASGETFFRLKFPNTDGNGRICATCHVPEEEFQLTPQNVEGRYQSLQARRIIDSAADDPLFRAMDANDGATTTAG